MIIESNSDAFQFIIDNKLLDKHIFISSCIILGLSPYLGDAKLFKLIKILERNYPTSNNEFSKYTKSKYWNNIDEKEISVYNYSFCWWHPDKTNKEDLKIILEEKYNYLKALVEKLKKEEDASRSIKQR